jgi:hypothetical protein
MHVYTLLCLEYRGRRMSSNQRLHVVLWLKHGACLGGRSPV